MTTRAQEAKRRNDSTYCPAVMALNETLLELGVDRKSVRNPLSVAMCLVRFQDSTDEKGVQSVADAVKQRQGMFCPRGLEMLRTAYRGAEARVAGGQGEESGRDCQAYRDDA